MPPKLSGTPGAIRAAIQIIRAKTGKVEEYDLILSPATEETKDDLNGS